MAGGRVWQGVCMAGACMGDMHGRGHSWQERWPLQRTVGILLECILVDTFEGFPEKLETGVVY